MIWLTLLVVFVASVAASLVQGTIGFGFGLLFLAMAGQWILIEDAVVVVALPALGLNVYLLFRLRDHLTLSRLGPMLVLLLIAAPLGVWFLADAPAWLLQVVLAVVLLAAVVQPMVGQRWQAADRPWHPWWLGGPCGALSGVLTGALGTGGPPLVAYVSSQRFERHRHVAAIQLLLGCGGLIRVIALQGGGLYTPQRWLLSGVGLVGIVAGGSIGLILLKHIHETTLRCVVLALLGLSAVVFLIKASLTLNGQEGIGLQ